VILWIKIAKINQLLGGNQLTLKESTRIDSKIKRNCNCGRGNGDMLRTLADFGLKVILKFQLMNR
jgi:hypothetical protein